MWLNKTNLPWKLHTTLQQSFSVLKSFSKTLAHLIILKIILVGKMMYPKHNKYVSQLNNETEEKHIS